jgi:hypothetical protein
MLRLVCAAGFAVLAYAVAHAASAAGLPEWAGLAGVGVLLMLAVSTLAFGPFAPHPKRGLPAGDPLLDRSALDAMERLHNSGRPLTARQISPAPDHAALMRRLHEARILAPVPQPQGHETHWALTPYGRALQARRAVFTPSRG